RIIQHVYNIHEPWHIPNHELLGFSVTPDGRYFMTGYIEANGPMPGYDVPPGKSFRSWLVLADTNGCRYPNDPACWPLGIAEQGEGQKEISIYPNPAHQGLKIDLPNAVRGNNYHAAIADITG